MLAMFQPSAWSRTMAARRSIGSPIATYGGKRRVTYSGAGASTSTRLIVRAAGRRSKRA